MKEPKSVRRGRIGAPVTRPTSWWLRTLRQRRESMYDDHEAMAPVAFADDDERRACISFFNAALRAEESGSAQAERLAGEVRQWDPELAECLELYGKEEEWHRGLIEQFLAGIGGHVQPLGGLTGFFYRTYGKARDLETIMLTNLMFEVIGSTTYRIALGRIKHPAVRKLLTILARDESFHVPLNVHFIREMRRYKSSGWLQTARLKSIVSRRLLDAAGVGGGEPARRRALRRHYVSRAGACLRRELGAAVRQRVRLALYAADAGAEAVHARQRRAHARREHLVGGGRGGVGAARERRRQSAARLS